MPLPKITTSEYELELPSNGKTIRYRPFLVKEEKILILALEGGNQKEITNAVKQVIKECVITKGLKVDTLPAFDIEYLFLNIRGKSVGEEVEDTVTCPDDNKTTVDVTIPVNAIEVQKNKDHKDTIKLDDTLMMKMRYPSLDQFVNSNFDTGTEGSQMEQSFDMIAACIDTIYTDEEAWTTSDCSKTEVVEFLDQLNTKQFQEIEAFFTTMPKLSYEIKVTNPKTKKKGTVVLEGLSSFFA